MTDPETPLPNAQHSGLFNKMKQFLSFDDQLNLLKSRHLVIKSLEQAKSILMSENYYRLSGYFKMFTKNDSNDFVDGFSMKKLYMIYSFDACLRHLISEYVSKIEINSRTRIAYVLAKMTSPISYLDSSNFVDHSYHSNFINKIREELVRNRRNPIVAHHSGQQMPIWALVEILTFGTVSKMFSNLKLNLRKAIASSNDYQARYREQVYTNNLQIVCNLRNICAHHGRLYGSLYPYNVLISNNDMMLFSRFGFPIPNNSTSNLFYLIFALCNLMMCEKDKKLFVKRLRLLFFKYRKYIDLNKIGFAKNWAKLLLKNK